MGKAVYRVGIWFRKTTGCSQSRSCAGRDSGVHIVPGAEADMWHWKMQLWAWRSTGGRELLPLRSALAAEAPFCKREALKSDPPSGQKAGEQMNCERTLTSQGIPFGLKGSSMGTLAAPPHRCCCVNAFLAFPYPDCCFLSRKEVSGVNLLPAQRGERHCVHIR